MRLSTTLALLTASLSTLASAQTERELGSHEHGAAFLNIAVDDGQVFLELESPWDNLVGFEHAPSTDEQHDLVDNAMALLNQPEQLFSFDGGGCVAGDATVESGMASGDDEHAHDDDHDKDDHHDEDAHGDDHDKDDHHDEDAHGDDHDKDDHHDEDAHGDDHDKDDHHDEDAHGDDHDKDDHHDEDAHGDDHNKDDDHAHGDHDDHADEGTHAEVLATYTFNCTDVNQLAAIDVTFLKRWSGFEDLDVQLIGPGGQAAAELGQSESVVDITQVQ